METQMFRIPSEFREYTLETLGMDQEYEEAKKIRASRREYERECRNRRFNRENEEDWY
jgi:hypothetical protein